MNVEITTFLGPVGLIVGGTTSPACQRHEREVQAVEVVAQIEDAREAGAGELGFDPRARRVAIGVG